ncbi:MAG: hypothetical protein WCI20_03515 [bacterium]
MDMASRIPSRRTRSVYIGGMLDQGLQSGALFLMTLLWARILSVDEFGVFALGQVIALYVGAVHTSLVSEPFSVNYARFTGSELLAYTRWANRLHWGLCGIIVVIFFAAAGVGWGFGYPNAAKVLVCVALATPAYNTLWQTRRVSYALAQPRRALVGTLIFIGVLSCGMVLVCVSTRPNAILSMLIFALAAVPTGLGMRGAGPDSSLGDPQAWWRDHWRYAKWHMAGIFVSGLGGVMAYPMLAWFGGVKVSGSLRLVETLYGPINQGLTSLGMVILPRLTQAREEGGMEMAVGRLRRVRALLLLAAIPLPLVAALWGGWGMRALFGEIQGSGLGTAVTWYAGLITARVVVDFGPAMVLRVARETRGFFMNGWITGIAGALAACVAAAYSVECVIAVRLAVAALSWFVFARYARAFMPGRSL